MTEHHVKAYIERVASVDQEQYPRWDLSKPLPNLPVPDLQKTLTKYMAIIKPILSPAVYKKTKEIVEDFGKRGGVGEVLQEQLRLYAETKENWAYNWWLDDMYLKIRLPLPINSNPGMIFPKQNFLEKKNQLRYASRLISGILDYKTIIDARGLPIDRARHKEKGQPMCMEQYYRLFTSYRCPGVVKDALIRNTSKLMPEPEHIIVICKNQFFVLDVMNNFSRLTEEDMYTQLQRIVKMAEENSEAAEKIGILTGAYRDKWAKARTRLMKESTNRDSLDAIERCIFILCLDDAVPLKFNHQNSIDETNMNIRDDVSLLCQMLHGLGTNLNSANRWFEKTMQFVISEDGACGLNYEHSPSEGIAVVQLIEHLLKYMEELRQKKLLRTKSLCELPCPRKLQWKICSETEESIAEASEHIERLIEDLDLYILKFEDFGKEFPKSQNMSPDSFIQLALQLTFYKIHNRLVSTYESASTRRFKLGRVDNIRSNSMAALAWVKAMIEETEASDADKMLLLRKAMDCQTEIMTQEHYLKKSDWYKEETENQDPSSSVERFWTAPIMQSAGNTSQCELQKIMQTILGHGVDCHLLGLREVAKEKCETIPPFFTDEGFRIANHFSLSTSQVPTTMDDAIMCYGPVVPDGYGVCYNPHPNNIVICITSFKSHSDTRSDYFAFTLESSLLQMHELCLKANEKTQIIKPVRTGSLDRSHGEGRDELNGSPRKQKLVRQKNANHNSAPDKTHNAS